MNQRVNKWMSEFWPIIVDSTLFYSLACVLNSWSLASCILYRRSWKLGQWDLDRSRLLRAGLQEFIFLGQSHHSFSASLHQLKGSSLPSPTMMDWAPWNNDLCPSFLPSLCSVVYSITEMRFGPLFFLFFQDPIQGPW